MKELLKKIDEMVDRPFVTAKFGDNWKEHAKDYYNLDAIANIAYRNGRKAILLERELIRVKEAFDKSFEQCTELIKQKKEVEMKFARYRDNNPDYTNSNDFCESCGGRNCIC